LQSQADRPRDDGLGKFPGHQGRECQRPSVDLPVKKLRRGPLRASAAVGAL
jgi:hypothetical protein